MNNNEKEALRWYLQGTRDARTAGRNSSNGDHEVSCFLYQEAAEKILKAFLYLRGENPVLGHSTLKLSERLPAVLDQAGDDGADLGGIANEGDHGQGNASML